MINIPKINNNNINHIKIKSRNTNIYSGSSTSNSNKNRSLSILDQQHTKSEDLTTEATFNNNGRRRRSSSLNILSKDLIKLRKNSSFISTTRKVDHLKKSSPYFCKDVGKSTKLNGYYDDEQYESEESEDYDDEYFDDHYFYNNSYDNGTVCPSIYSSYGDENEEDDHNLSLEFGNVSKIRSGTNIDNSNTSLSNKTPKIGGKRGGGGGGGGRRSGRRRRRRSTSDSMDTACTSCIQSLTPSLSSILLSQKQNYRYKQKNGNNDSDVAITSFCGMTDITTSKSLNGPKRAVSTCTSDCSTNSLRRVKSQISIVQDINAHPLLALPLPTCSKRVLPSAEKIAINDPLLAQESQKHDSLDCNTDGSNNFNSAGSHCNVPDLKVYNMEDLDLHTELDANDIIQFYDPIITIRSPVKNGKNSNKHGVTIGTAAISTAAPIHVSTSGKRYIELKLTDTANSDTKIGRVMDALEENNDNEVRVAPLSLSSNNGNSANNTKQKHCDQPQQRHQSLSPHFMKLYAIEQYCKSNNIIPDLTVDETLLSQLSTDEIKQLDIPLPAETKTTENDEQYTGLIKLSLITRKKLWCDMIKNNRQDMFGGSNLPWNKEFVYLDNGDISNTNIGDKNSTTMVRLKSNILPWHQPVYTAPTNPTGVNSNAHCNDTQCINFCISPTAAGVDNNKNNSGNSVCTCMIKPCGRLSKGKIQYVVKGWCDKRFVS
ncbi:Gis3p SCDLUD_001715 [Saccharomycodes ludwigii]|uniref:Gis3p n=1 Tax=Saccharomycodes ludwigii TaxID=36035 RepID=UPI001E83B124|nr:hypothetical protein SCDLUD_001715 [Saccharomycodes ludwigii]KAH3901930.1 hypothetical protein SCDLUD_001715 [Saccharomycodes ludwigii]